MRATYKRLIKAQQVLRLLGVKSYVPMRIVVNVVNRKRITHLEPAISNLIFVQASVGVISDFRTSIPYLIPFRDLKDGRKEVMIISDKEMEQFIAVTQANIEKLIYIDTKDVALAKGTRIRIKEGEFKGVEGVLMKVKGARDKRVVVSLEGIMSVAMATIDISLIEKV